MKVQVVNLIYIQPNGFDDDDDHDIVKLLWTLSATDDRKVFHFAETRPFSTAIILMHFYYHYCACTMYVLTLSQFTLPVNLNAKCHECKYDRNIILIN